MVEAAANRTSTSRTAHRLVEAGIRTAHRQAPRPCPSVARLGGRRAAMMPAMMGAGETGARRSMTAGRGAAAGRGLAGDAPTTLPLWDARRVVETVPTRVHSTHWGASSQHVLDPIGSPYACVATPCDTPCVPQDRHRRYGCRAAIDDSGSKRAVDGLIIRWSISVTSMA